MIYQFVNTRTEILAIATSHIVYLCNNFNNVFARIISIPRFNNLALILIKICLRLKNFCQKITKFSSAGSLPDSRNSPFEQISGYAPYRLCA